MSGVRARCATAAIATAGAIGLTITLAQLPAGASVRSGWRVTNVIGPVAGATYVSDFVVTGRANAWSTWGTCNPCSSPSKQTFTVERWNGRSWRSVPFSPAQETNETSSSVAFGASSSSNAWLFNGFQDHITALQWNGRAWKARPVPSWVVRSNLSGTYAVSAEVFSPKSMWVFSSFVDSFTKPEHFAARYSAGRWTKVQLPGIPTGVLLQRAAVPLRAEERGVSSSCRGPSGCQCAGGGRSCSRARPADRICGLRRAP